MTGRLEERLRDAFEARVADPPALHAPADTALGRADVTRRRRRIAVVAAAAAVVVLVAGGVGAARLTDRAAPAPAATGPSASDAAPGSGPATVDLVVDGAIRTAGGKAVPLSDGAPAQPAYGWRVPAGWLLVDAPGNAVSRLALVGADGQPLASTPAVSPVVSADGQRDAWAEPSGGSGDTDRVTAVTIGGSPLGVLPLAGAEPLGWWQDSLVLSRPGSASGSRVLSLWTPGGAAPARWSAPLDGPRLLGPTADGRYLLAAVPGPTLDPATGNATYCVAELDPANGLAQRARTCPGLATVPSESPDHRWLVVPGHGGDPGRAYDVATLFRTGGTATRPACALTGDGDPVWESADTYLVTSGATLNRCRVGSPATVRVVDPRLAGARTVLALSPVD